MAIFAALLVACSNEQTFDDFFYAKMEKHKKDFDEEVHYSYSLVHKEENVVKENDAITIFRENNLQGDQIFIAYFERENGIWMWKNTRGAEWNSFV
ncbi:hypothetical protein J23TS9_23580 [Paenibacillus sp. J23TS9]|nr:hypothetical protein J23TS9_23580 [Paenibacillus sp. J23TS9]